MIDVGGYDHTATRHFSAYNIWREPLTLSYKLHLLGNNAGARIVQLGEVAVAVFRLAARDPLGTRLYGRVSIIPICRIAVGGTHDLYLIVDCV